MSFWNSFKLEKDKREIVSSPTFEKGKENVKVGRRYSEFQILFSSERERERDFSLDLRTIRSSEFVGTRRKVALRDEVNAWTPVLGVFDKLREVEVSSYLSFTLCLSVFTMLELNETVRGLFDRFQSLEPR